MSAPLRLSFDVACSAEHAFTVWTSEIGAWWPPDHTVTGQPDLVVVLQGGVGGRIYERTADGVEHDWGQVTAWNPPTRLAYLWHLRRDRADATEVEIRPTGDAEPEGPAVCRLPSRRRSQLSSRRRARRRRNPLATLAASGEFQSGINERCAEGPSPADATVVGSYRMLTE
jgi:uncharacterized protein YndB with AHSA1/START domain